MPEFLDWKSEYSVGDEHIDTQHQHLFHLANKVLRMKASAASTAELKPLLVGLCEYIQFHFDDEQNLMESVGYPDLEEHRKRHQAIIHAMNTMMRSSKGIQPLLDRLAEIMEVWTLKHIVIEDAQVGKHLRRSR